MDDKYGYFMSYDSEYHKTRHKLNMFIKSLEGERDMNIHPSEHYNKKSLIVLQMPQYKNVPMINNQAKVDLFRHRYMLMLMMKFSPFIKSVDFVYWKYGS